MFKLLKGIKLEQKLLFIFFFVSLTLRLWGVNFVIVEGGKWVIFLQPDAYYHMRRSAVFAYNFPNIPTLDYFMAYPFGAECPWPPLYDMIIAYLSLIFGLGKFSLNWIQIFTAILPPVISSLTIIAVYFFVLELWGNKRLALLSSFFTMFMPGMLGYSTVASGDHHVAETLLFVLFYFLLAKSIRKIFLKLSYKKELFYTSLIFTISLLIWQGQIVFYTVCSFFLIVALFMLRENKEINNNLSKYFFMLGFIIFISVSVFRIIVPISTEQSFFNYAFFSFFQPVYILILSTFVYLFGYLSRYANKNDKLILKVIPIVLIIMMIIFFVKPLREGVIYGIKFLLKDDPWLSTINEFQRSFSLSMFVFWDRFETYYNLLYFLTFIVPFIMAMVGLYIVIYKKRYFIFRLEELIKKCEGFSHMRNCNIKVDRNVNYLKYYKLNEIFIFTISIFFCLLAFHQKRWTNAYSPIMAIGLGIVLNFLYLKIKKSHFIFKNFYEWLNVTKGIRKKTFFERIIIRYEKSPLIMSLVFTLILFVPYYISAKKIVTLTSYPISPELNNTLMWMRQYLPPACNNPFDANEKPKYSVFSVWDLGHFIQYLAEKPTVVNNFGNVLRGDGYKLSHYLWSVEDENELNNLVEKYGIKFLLLTDPVGHFTEGSKVYYKEGFLEKYFDLVNAHGGNITFYNPKPTLFGLPMFKMLLFDGSSTSFGSALKNYRLIFESKNPSPFQYFPENELKSFKIYEYVKGVTVKGRAEARSIVYVYGEFLTNFDRPFFWQAASIADDEGNFTLTLPYSTAEDNYFVVPLAPFNIYSGDKKIMIGTTNDDVLNGKTINVDFKNATKIDKDEILWLRDKLKSFVAKPEKRMVNIHKKLYKEKN